MVDNGRWPYSGDPSVASAQRRQIPAAKLSHEFGDLDLDFVPRTRRDGGPLPPPRRGPPPPLAMRSSAVARDDHCSFDYHQKLIRGNHGPNTNAKFTVKQKLTLIYLFLSLPLS